MVDAIVFGNVTLDVICKTVNDVPRHESLTFDQVAVMPGGCGSNVALGLCALGVPTALVACIGSDESASMVRNYWGRFGLDQRFVHIVPDQPTGTSIGLVDSEAQPRFIHTSGANALLNVDTLDIPALSAEGARILHIAGFFVLPGILDGRLPKRLAAAQECGIVTSLDVVRSKRMQNPDLLWPSLPYLDVFLCNAHEAWRLTGEEKPENAGRSLRFREAKNVIIKLGIDGCWLENAIFSGRIEAPRVDVVDTTGAGDAFAAGLIHALLNGEKIESACVSANQAGAHIVGSLGAVGGWLKVVS
jgi:sugar/nucleoside kinase (ribokinase family)